MYYNDMPEAYKAAVLSDVDDSTMVAYLDLAPPEAFKATISTSASSFTGHDWSIPPTARGMGAPWASFEQDRIWLDGTYQFPTASSYCGKWWDPSDTVQITVTLPSAADIPGVTVVFDDEAGEYASSFTIEMLDASGEQVEIQNVTGNDQTRALTLAEVGVGVKTIIVTIDPSSWVGGYYTKVSAVFPGMLYTFENEDIISFELTEELTIYGSSLAVPQNTLVVDDSAAEFAPHNNRGISNALESGCPLRCYMIVGGTQVNMGEWYVYDWSSNQEAMTATFTSRPRIGFDVRFTNVTKSIRELAYVVRELATKCGIEDKLGEIPEIEPLPDEFVQYFGIAVQGTAGMQTIANSAASCWKIQRDETYDLLSIEGIFGRLSPELAAPCPLTLQMVYPEIIGERPFEKVIIQAAYLYGGEVQQVEYVYPLGGRFGDVFYAYANQLHDAAMWPSLFDVINAQAASLLSGAIKVRGTIKGNPALAAGDVSMVELPGAGGTTERCVLLTKTTTRYSSDILTTEIEGIVDPYAKYTEA